MRTSLFHSAATHERGIGRRGAMNTYALPAGATDASVEGFRVESPEKP
jgi:hypothetical protein